MEIGESTSKTLEKLGQEQKKSHNGHVRFLSHCHNVSDWASPLCQWTILWSSCPPPTNAQRRSGLSGNTLNCKETITYNRTGLCMPTNWWMEDIPRAGDSRGLVHHWTSRRWIQHILKSLPLLKRYVYCPTFVLLFSYISYGCLTFSIFSVILLFYFFIRVCWTACGEINLLSQGVIICYVCLCPIHGHCYWYHIIDGVECRKDPFYLLLHGEWSSWNLLWFCMQPRWIFVKQDFWCNTRFWHDIFHSYGHLCGNNYKPTRIESFRCINMSSLILLFYVSCTWLHNHILLFFLQFFIAIWNKKKTALYISKKQKIILHNRCWI